MTLEKKAAILAAHGIKTKTEQDQLYAVYTVYYLETGRKETETLNVSNFTGKELFDFLGY